MFFNTFLTSAAAAASLIVLSSASVIEERSSSLATVITTCKKTKEAALTFDDGPYMYGHYIANNFTSYNSHTTFFVNGYNWDCIYDFADELQARYNAGHLIGSHTWNHYNISELTVAQFEQELDLVETALLKILGIKPRFFRPPYGAYNAAALKILKKRGYEVVKWSFDSGDSGGIAPATTVANYEALIQQYPEPFIALNHETYTGTANIVVPQILPMILQKGYKLVTLADCLGVSPYQAVGSAGVRDSTWTCDGTPAPGTP